jgi:hypothetical protein
MTFENSKQHLTDRGFSTFGGRRARRIDHKIDPFVFRPL